MVADIMTNKEFRAMIKELFIITYRKVNISLVFITQSDFSVAKDVRLNSTHFENQQQKRITKYRNKSFCRYWLQRFYEVYRECTKEPYSLLTIDTTLPISDILRFGKNFFQSYIKMTVTDQIKILEKLNKMKHSMI